MVALVFPEARACSPNTQALESLLPVIHWLNSGQSCCLVQMRRVEKWIPPLIVGVTKSIWPVFAAYHTWLEFIHLLYVVLQV